MTEPTTYEIRVAGHLDDHWAAVFSDLARVRDVGVPLLTVRPLTRTGRG